MGDLEPSSNQAGSGEQFKRGGKYISPGGTNVPQTLVSGTLEVELSGLVQSVDCDGLWEGVSGTLDLRAGGGGKCGSPPSRTVQF